ncbi:hypothetical protein QTG56_24525 (plasmid) [Rossellomorea sp. AcN35-11]|nr:hypothetical protein [Rossellomorea aquimaris]WJV31801.1 hypothetical protein QTG56_24525 [Rossellomorea sp. AcN35-11]
MNEMNRLYGKLLIDKRVESDGLSYGRVLRKGTVFRHISAATDKRLGRFKEFTFEFKDDEVQWI